MDPEEWKAQWERNRRWQLPLLLMSLLWVPMLIMIVHMMKR